MVKAFAATAHDSETRFPHRRRLHDFAEIPAGSQDPFLKAKIVIIFKYLKTPLAGEQPSTKKLNGDAA